MKLEWMGRNRELIRQIMKFVNLFTRSEKKATVGKSGIALNAQQWQTLECIIEYEDENKNMVFMANQIGLQKSTFTMYVKLLFDYGLVERYQQTDNRKDIILKPSEKGRTFYKEHSKILARFVFGEVFSTLDKLSEENMAIIVDSLSKLVTNFEPNNNKTRMKLFKLQ